MAGQQKILGKKHLFFDLDHTLWDYETNSNETLVELWQTYSLGDEGVNQLEFLTQFGVVNNQLWDLFHQGIIGKDTIRNDRFKKIFNSLEVDHLHFVEQIQEDYLAICPTKPNVITDAHMVLEALAPHYNLHIITNGFDEIQSIKLGQSGLTPFFDKIITSGGSGFQKPEPGIFEYALQLAQTTAKESVMIGDNPESDIVGAANAGIAQIFYNPQGSTCRIKPTAEIQQLRSLLDLLI